jgi:hypothetical protein
LSHLAQTCDTRFRTLPFQVGRTGQKFVNPLHFRIGYKEKDYTEKKIYCSVQIRYDIRPILYSEGTWGWGWVDDTRDGTKQDAVSEIMSESGETIIAGNKRWMNMHVMKRWNEYDVEFDYQEVREYDLHSESRAARRSREGNEMR